MLCKYVATTTRDLSGTDDRCKQSFTPAAIGFCLLKSAISTFSTHLTGLLGVLARLSILQFEATCDMSIDQLYVTPIKQNN